MNEIDSLWIHVWKNPGPDDDFHSDYSKYARGCGVFDDDLTEIAFDWERASCQFLNQTAADVASAAFDQRETTGR